METANHIVIRVWKIAISARFFYTPCKSLYILCHTISWRTCVLTKGSKDVWRCVSDVGLPKRGHKAPAHSAVVRCPSCPTLQELGSHALVVPH